MRKSKKSADTSPFLFLLVGWLALLMAAYGRLILHPEIHTACPENDTWNLPIRWSVLSSLRDGKLPLWNPLSAFGIPWLATWQTESFYPGTLLFTSLGLSAWNLSGLIHLCVLSLGILYFLRATGVPAFWALFSAAIALLNGCAYNHLGSNSSMDTMAWIPWMLLSTLQVVGNQPWSRVKWAVFFALQVFAGYPQIILYSLAACLAYALFLGGKTALLRLLPSFGAGLLLTAAQWLPSVEYFFLNCVRLPPVQGNPNFFLPLANLKTFFDFNALSREGMPDYVADPTFFYFNFYSGFLPLILLLGGVVQARKLNADTRFFLIGFGTLVLWTLGFFLRGLEWLHIPFPAFLEAAKAWVLVDIFELLAVGTILRDLFPKPGPWKWVALAVAVANLLYPVWTHPLERNLTPADPQWEVEVRSIKSHLGEGRLLVVLPNAKERTQLYTPMPDPERKALFKHFVPNTNLFAFLPEPVFYGSTLPSWGALDADFYFQYVFPKDGGALMDLLGVDLLYLPENDLPSRYKKIQAEGAWVLWHNPSSLGSHFFFYGKPQAGDRKNIFTAFASGKARPLQDLFLSPQPASLPPLASEAPLEAQETNLPGKGKAGWLVVTQNAMPGWRAWVEGRPQALGLVDGIFLGVPFQPGDKTVRLSYEPASFRFGLFLSLWALGLGLSLTGLRLVSNSTARRI